ncbi:MAG: NUDIX domain-containing protein [Candidatus Diapherotrites archaeon]|nr:NUDIX domain-containing protein [Candidatus Diapherotrites archaeon]
MDNFRVAVKALILDDENNLLLVRRSHDDKVAAGLWEIPGGRLELGESPFDGLKREVMEETGIPIDIGAPVNVQHFTNTDKVVITMIIFKCKALSKEVKLVDGELSEFGWVKIPEAKAKITKYFHKEIDILEKMAGV